MGHRLADSHNNKGGREAAFVVFRTPGRNRAHGSVFAPDAGIEKFDGDTAAWLRSSFEVRSLNELRSLVDDEDWELGRTA